MDLLTVSKYLVQCILSLMPNICAHFHFFFSRKTNLKKNHFKCCANRLCITVYSCTYSRVHNTSCKWLPLATTWGNSFSAGRCWIMHTCQFFHGPIINSKSLINKYTYRYRWSNRHVHVTINEPHNCGVWYTGTHYRLYAHCFDDFDERVDNK